MVEFKQSFFDDIYTRGLAHSIVGGTIVDIGAHIGCFTIYAASQLACDRVIAIEPDAGNFRWLQKNAALNPERSIVTVEAAIGPTNGPATFFNAADSKFSTGGTLIAGRGEQRGYLTRTVPCMTLEAAFRDYGVSRCALLKLDCEGAEYDILDMTPDSVFDRVDQIAMELHEIAGRPAAGVLDRLHDLGFAVEVEGPIVWASRTAK